MRDLFGSDEDDDDDDERGNIGGAQYDSTRRSDDEVDVEDKDGAAEIHEIPHVKPLPPGAKVGFWCCCSFFQFIFRGFSPILSHTLAYSSIAHKDQSTVSSFIWTRGLALLKKRTGVLFQNDQCPRVRKPAIRPISLSRPQT